MRLFLAAIAAMLALASAQAQTSGCMCCNCASPPWTLYKFYRYPSGFEQQQLSGHDSAEACRAAFERDTTPHPVTRGLCTYFNGTQPAFRLEPKP